MSTFSTSVDVSRPVSVARPTSRRIGRPQSKKFNSARDLGADMVSNPMIDAGISGHNSKGRSYLLSLLRSHSITFTLATINLLLTNMILRS